MKFIDEFKEFINRGNVMDLAVGVIIGGAFTGIVTALTTNIINPLIAVFAGGGVILGALKELVGQLVGIGVKHRDRGSGVRRALFSEESHQRLPPFLSRLIRGSQIAMAMSPSSRPNTPMIA